MKKFLPIVVFLCIGVFGAFSQGQKDPAALTILESMSAKYKAYPSFAAEFTNTLINPDKSTEEISGKVTVMGEKYRLDLGDQEVINDGETIWTFLKDVNEVNVTEFYPEDQDITLSNIFTIYENGYKYVYVEQQAANHVIDLEPEGAGRDIYKIRMVISDNSELQSFTLFERSGVKYQYAINQFDSNVEIADDYFSWDESKNPDVEVIDFRN